MFWAGWGAVLGRSGLVLSGAYLQLYGRVYYRAKGAVWRGSYWVGEAGVVRWPRLARGTRVDM